MAAIPPGVPQQLLEARPHARLQPALRHVGEGVVPPDVAREDDKGQSREAHARALEGPQGHPGGGLPQDEGALGAHSAAGHVGAGDATLGYEKGRARRHAAHHLDEARCDPRLHSDCVPLVPAPHQGPRRVDQRRATLLQRPVARSRGPGDLSNPPWGRIPVGKKGRLHLHDLERQAVLGGASKERRDLRRCLGYVAPADKDAPSGAS